MPSNTPFAQHPLWQVGFRPFFSLAILSGILLPLLWILALHGNISLPTQRINPVQWHAHEMFYGFGWAVLGGFLLTSTKNWVNIRGYHGNTLIALSAAWLLERLILWQADALPAGLFLLGAYLFPASLIVLLLATLIHHRAQDSYRIDNRFFLVALPLFLIAKTLTLHSDSFTAGWTMTLALFRLAFLVMLERTLTQFMKAALQHQLLRDPRLDQTIKFLALGLVFSPWLPPLLGSTAQLLLAALLTLRFMLWQPLAALRRIDLGIMYLGQIGIIAQLSYSGLAPLLPLDWPGTPGVHLFSFGTMGLIIPAMLIRIGNGHTGRKVLFDRRDKASLWLMIAATACRIGGPIAQPEHSLRWLDLAAAGWWLAFGLLALRYIPYFLKARVDGRLH